MSVLIKDMEKPESCYEVIDGKSKHCQFVNLYDNCILLLKQGICGETWEQQYSKCPLVEAPEMCEDVVSRQAAKNKDRSIFRTRGCVHVNRYIRSFSFSRKKAIDKLDGLSIEINEYVIKCIIFGDYRKDSYNHWIYEISSWLQSCDNRSISRANLKDRDYRESLFGHFGDCVSDAENNLLHFKSSNLYKYHKKNPTTALPYYRINDEMIDCLYDCYTELIDTCIPILQSSKEHNLAFWKKLVKSIIDSHVYEFKDEDIVENIYDE